MLKKRYMTLMILSLLMCMVAVSAVSATDSDDVAIDDAIGAVDEDSIGAVDEDNLAIENDENEDDESQELLASEAEISDVVSKDDSKDTLSISSPTYDKYDVEFDSSSEFIETGGDYIYVYADTGYDTTYYAYDFYLKIYNQQGSEVFSKNIYTSDDDAYGETYLEIECYISDLSEGTYTMKLINYKDGHVFDTATLYVTDYEEYETPVSISTSGYYSSYYNSNKKFTIKVTETGTGIAASYVSLKVQFKKGGKTITKYYTTGSDGKVSFVPPLSVGTWTATVSITDPDYTGTDKKNTIKITKSAVKIKTKKVSQYQGIKFKLKATVKNQAGKAVKEGKVQFKINGKTYKVSVKNGVATKKLKLGKVKSYKFKAKYLGSANFKKSKTAKNKVKIKKRYKTKVILTKKTYKGKFGSYVTVKVKVRTKEGKKVKGGWISLKSVTGYKHWAQVKNGKASYTFRLNSNYNYYSYYTYYYSKNVVSKFKIKYEPSSYKYKCSASKKIKIKEKYKCPLCGKSKSHSHVIGGYYYYMSVS